MAGKIKKLLENELVGGTQSSDVYPVTSIKAVYDEDNERLDNIINRKGIVNISTNYNSDHIAEVFTLAQAISKVPSKDRVLGFQGKFLTSEGWKSYMFTGDSLSNWTDITKWIEQISTAVLAQELGNSSTKAISQEAVTKEMNNLNNNTGVSEYEEFSESENYDIGDIVIYEGKLYEFTQEHISSSWDNNHIKPSSVKSDTDKKLSELKTFFAKKIDINIGGVGSVPTNLYFKKNVKYIMEVSSPQAIDFNFIIGDNIDYYITISKNNIIEFTPSKDGYARCYFFNAFNGSIFFNVKKYDDVNDKLEGNISYNHLYKTYYIIKEDICLNDIDIYIISRNKSLNFLQLYKANNVNEAIDGTVTTLYSVEANVLYKVNIPASDLANKVVINSSETDNDIVVFISKNSSCIYDYIYPLIKDINVYRINVNKKTKNFNLSDLGFAEGDTLSVEISSTKRMDWLQFLFIDNENNVLEPAQTIYNIKDKKFSIPVLSGAKTLRLNVATADSYSYIVKIAKQSFSSKVLERVLSPFNETIVVKTITYTLDRLNLNAGDNIYVNINSKVGELDWLQFLFLSKDGSVIEPAKTIFNLTKEEFYYVIPTNAVSLKLNVAEASSYKYALSIERVSNIENDIIKKIETLQSKESEFYVKIIDAYAVGSYTSDTENKFYGVDNNGKNAIQRAIESTLNIDGKKLIRCHGSFIANKLSDFTVENSPSTSPDYIYHSFVSVNGYKDITLKGDGKHETFIIGDLSKESTSFEVEKYQTVQAEADGLIIEDLTIIGSKVRYPVHIDKSGTGLIETQRLDNTTQVFNRVNIIAKKGGLGNALGVGIASGQKIILNDCYVKSFSDTATYYHDGRPFTNSPLMQFNRCQLESEGDKLFTGQVSGAVVPCYVEFNNCTYNNYKIFVQDASIKFDMEYDYRKNMRLIVNGAGNSPAKYAPELRTRVLKITAIDNTKDVTFDTNCSAFDVLIKGIDIQYKEFPNGLIYENSYARRNNYAYGLKTISCVDYFTMKDILGNRSSSAIELIVNVGSESITIPFNKDYSATDDNTIINEINAVLSDKAKASLTADNIEVYQNFSDAFLPLKNTSSEYIEKGSIVQKNGNGIGKYKGLGNIYGIALDDMRAGQIGNILIKGIVGKLSAETWGINAEIQKGKYLTTDDSGNIQVSDIPTNIYCIDNNNVIIE